MLDHRYRNIHTEHAQPAQCMQAKLSLTSAHAQLDQLIPTIFFMYRAIELSQLPCADISLLRLSFLSFIRRVSLIRPLTEVHHNQCVKSHQKWMRSNNAMWKAGSKRLSNRLSVVDCLVLVVKQTLVRQILTQIVIDDSQFY